MYDSDDDSVDSTIMGRTVDRDQFVYESASPPSSSIPLPPSIAPPQPPSSTPPSSSFSTTPTKHHRKGTMEAAMHVSLKNNNIQFNQQERTLFGYTNNNDMVSQKGKASTKTERKTEKGKASTKTKKKIEKGKFSTKTKRKTAGQAASPSMSAHATDGTGISIDAIEAMVSQTDKSSTKTKRKTTGQPAFRYRSVQHRRMSDGLVGGYMTSTADGRTGEPSATVTSMSSTTSSTTEPTSSMSGLQTEPTERIHKSTKPSLASIEKQTKARILNTIVAAIHARRSLFGSTISDVKRAFNAFDQNGDGLISPEEFRSAIRRLGLGLSELQMTACFDVLGNGKYLDYHHFTDALQNRRDSSSDASD